MIFTAPCKLTYKQTIEKHNNKLPNINIDWNIPKFGSFT